MEEFTDLVPHLTALPPTAELLLTTNTKTLIKLTGVAKCSIRNSREDPSREGYLVLYEKRGIAKKAEVSKQLYDALHLVYDSILALDFVGDEEMPKANLIASNESTEDYYICDTTAESVTIHLPPAPANPNLKVYLRTRDEIARDELIIP